MRRFVTLVAAFVLTGLMAPAALAGNHENHGPPEDVGPGDHVPTIAQLEEAGWHCFDPDDEGPLGVHCVPPGSPLHPDSNTDGTALASGVMVFDGDGVFAGTELLRFTDADLSELPCPKDEGGHWHWNDGGFWACHHWRGAPQVI